MITIEDVKFETRSENYTDEQIQRIIERTKSFLIGYTNNPLLFEQDTLGVLDDVLLYVVASRMNENLKGLQGVASESVGGASYSALNDLPGYLRQSLNQFRRANLR
ncbi:hypothetical protein ABEX78_32300 [Priestia megaterium]